MRGVFKTTDGGRTWTKVFYKSARTGANDLVMDPRDPNTLYAAMWQRMRRKWSDPRVEPGYNEGGIFKTTDGGKTWTDVERRACRRRSSAAASASTLARSTSRTRSTRSSTTTRSAAGRSQDERDAYGRPMPQGAGFIKGAEVYRSDDGGKTWKQTSRYDARPTTYLDQPFGHVRLGVRPDPRRSEGREHDLHARPRAERVARRRQDVRAHRRHARRPPRAVDRSGELEDDLQQQRRRLLHVDRRGQDVEVRAVGARDAVLQRRARHGTPFHAYGSIQDVGSRRVRDRPQQRPRRSRRSRSKARPAAKARTTPSIRTTRTSSTRTGSTATSRART